MVCKDELVVHDLQSRYLTSSYGGQTKLEIWPSLITTFGVYLGTH